MNKVVYVIGIVLSAVLVIFGAAALLIYNSALWGTIGIICGCSFMGIFYGIKYVVENDKVLFD